jgi:hypothetical protein
LLAIGHYRDERAKVFHVPVCAAVAETLGRCRAGTPRRAPAGPAFPTHPVESTMNRFLATCFLALFALSAAMPASAERNFPPRAKRGELKAHQYPNYKIGKTVYRMSAGGRIYNEQNMIIMPVSLQRQTAQVIYLVDMNGQLSALWLLTRNEAAKYPLPKPSAADKKKAEEEKKRLEAEEKKKKEAAAGNG